MKIGIVGLGKVGRALAHALHAAELDGPSPARAFTMSFVSSRREQAAIELSDKLRGVTAIPIGELGSIADLILIASSDADIATTAMAIAAAPNTIIAHVSGATSLEPLATAGGRPGSFHPMMSFPPALEMDTARLLTRFKRSSVAIDGNESVRKELCELAAVLGMSVLHVPTPYRAEWHAAAVLAGNASTALIVLAENMLKSLPVQSADKRNALASLMLDVAENILALPANIELSEAISGPIARHDLSTVAKHVSTFNDITGNQAENRDAYIAASSLVIMALRNKLSPNQITELYLSLNQEPQN